MCGDSQALALVTELCCDRISYCTQTLVTGSNSVPPVCFAISVGSYFLFANGRSTVMPSSHDLYTLTDDHLLAREERIHRFKNRLIAMIISHLFWSLFRLVFDFMQTGVIHPHIVVATIVGLSYYTSKLCKAGRFLFRLHQEIGSRPGLVRWKLTTRDYMEVAASGMSFALRACGAVEALDLTLGVRNRGPRLFLNIPGSR